MGARRAVALAGSLLAAAGAAAEAPVVLDQGLTTEERRRFYHLSVGSQLLPLSVLRALHDPETGKPFLENPERFGMLPSDEDPDGLPIGLTQQRGRGSSVLGPIAGITCAACHVTELRYEGRAVRIDGAAGLMDFERFSAELSKALGALQSPSAFAGFLARIVTQRSPSPPLEPLTPAQLTGIGGVAPPPQKETYGAAIRTSLTEWSDKLAETKRLFGGKLDFFGRMGRMEQAHPAGPGRADDWVLARNLLFEEAAWLPRGAASASFPAVWNYDQYDWLTWNGATLSGMERGVATVMGLGALYDEAYESTVSPAAIIEHDRIAAKIRPPVWPEAVLGPIDRVAAARGAEVYAAECAACHDAPQAFSHDEVGADRTHAESWAIPLGARAFDGRFETEDQPSFADALSRKIGRFTAHAYAAEGWSDAQIEAAAPVANEVWRPVLQVMTRPLDAVWATAPYLVNGSVPTIEALLTPPEERPTAFPLGHFDYDPAALGYRTDVPREQAVFWFDTTLPGNAATGHAYGVDLPASDKRALIEYLKTR